MVSTYSNFDLKLTLVYSFTILYLEIIAKRSELSLNTTKSCVSLTYFVSLVHMIDFLEKTCEIRYFSFPFATFFFMVWKAVLKYIWDKVFKSGLSKFRGKKNSLIKRTIFLQFFKGCLPQILLGPFLNALSYLTNWSKWVM